MVHLTFAARTNGVSARLWLSHEDIACVEVLFELLVTIDRSGQWRWDVEVCKIRQ